MMALNADGQLRYPAATATQARRELLSPVRVLWHSATAADSETLLRSNEKQAFVSAAAAVCRLPPGAGLLLDYGIELHGGIRIVCGRSDQGVNRVRIRFGESASEAMGAPNNDHALHDTILDLPSHGMVSYGQTGFRFLRLDVAPDAGGEVLLLGVFAEAAYRDLVYAGSFHCSDERLNRIWQTGAYTVHLNMQDYIYDGIKRDRLVWMGDLNPEIRVIASVFDDRTAVPDSLDFVRDRTAPGTPINGISSYSAWWVINQYDWFQYRGDVDYLRRQHSYLRAVLRQLAGYVGADGRENFEAMRFLDWSSADNEAAVHAGLQGVLAWAFDAGERLCLALGDADDAKLCASCRHRLLAHCPDPGFNKPAAALLALAGFGHPATVNTDILARHPFAGLSTFMGYYVLEARAKAGDYAGALEVIRHYWGGMLDFGATTFWEDFDLDWLENSGRIDELPISGKHDLHADFGKHCYTGLRHSLCHGWAGGPTAWLSEHLLGVKFLEPGGRTVAVAPRLLDLEWLEGTFPTAYGPIKVTAERRADGSLASDVRLPK
jgi:hypothetical protein